MLHGLTVVEAGGTVASAAAGAMLRALGASVVKVVADDESHRATGENGTQIERVLRVLDRGKSVRRSGHLVDDECLSLLAKGDIAIADISQSQYWALPRWLPSYKDSVTRRNSGSWVTISPFGMSGKRARYRGSELTSVAAGGIMYFMRSSAGRPMKPAGFSGSIAAGHLAVLAALHGLRLKAERGRPAHLDLSLQDSVVVTGAFFECGHKLFDCPGPGGMARYLAPAGVLPAGSGSFCIVALEDHQWQGCVRAMGSPTWTHRIISSDDRLRYSAEIDAGLIEWGSQYTAEQCCAMLQAEGVPATPLNSCKDLLRDIDLIARGFFADGGGVGEQVPDLPAVLIPQDPSSRGADLDLDLSRLGRRPRVLDMSHVLAAPLATAWLGAIGLDVLKIEDPARTDVYRRRGPFAEGVNDIERSAYFSVANHSKRSASLSLSSADGQRILRDLANAADLVVENLSVSRATQLGLTADAFKDLPQTTLLSSSGFGRASSKAMYRAYGHNIHAYGGAIYLSRDRQGKPRNLGTAWADPLTAIWLAVLCLAQLFRPEGQRLHVDLAMGAVVAYQFPEFFSLLSGEGIELVADESRLDHAVPHGVYRCDGEDNWIALSAETDEEWARLVDALGAPPSLSQPQFASYENRMRLQSLIDQRLDNELSGRRSDLLFNQLQAQGIACSPVWGSRDLINDDHLWERGVFQYVTHPVWGERGLVGLPWQIVEVGSVPISRPPLFGEHTPRDGEGWWLPE